MPPLAPASGGADVTAAALRNVAAGVTLADAVDALRSLDPATPAGACAACTACATLALLLRRPEGATCFALACTHCPQDVARQAEASTLGAQAALLRTLQAGADNAGVALYTGWGLGALCGGGRGAALDPATAAACVGALTDALNAHSRVGVVVVVSLATALTALFDNAAAVRAAAQCDTATALFAAVATRTLCMPPEGQAQEPDLTQFERLGDALMALLDATDDAGVCAVAEARGGAAVTITLCALFALREQPHTAARFAGVLALLCKPSAGARRAALASTVGDGAVAAVCTLLKRAAELHLPPPLHALCVLLQSGDARETAAPLARAAGAIQLIAAAMEAHDGAPTVPAEWGLICSSALCVVTEDILLELEGDDDDGHIAVADERAVVRAALRVLRTHAHLDVAVSSAANLLSNVRRPERRRGGSSGGGGRGTAAQEAELARMRVDAIVPMTAALKRHVASLSAASTALRALTALMSAAPEKNEGCALAAGVAPAAVAAMRAHAANTLLQMRALNVLAPLAVREDVSALLAAGVPAAVAAASTEHPSTSRLGILVLYALVARGPVSRGAHAAAAVAAGGALEAAVRVLLRHRDEDEESADELRVTSVQLLHSLLAGCAHNAARAVARVPHVRALLADVEGMGAALRARQASGEASALAAALTAALAAHDAAEECGTPAACVRCAEQRREGSRCGLAACGARRRHEQPAKGLLRCSSCLAAAYCCGEHQREAWAAHKPACREARAAAAAVRAAA
jgi:hypothetical protein